MNTPSLTSTHLKRAIDLLAKKEALQTQLAAIDSEVAALFKGSTLPPAGKAPVKAKTAKAGGTKSKGRGVLKESILAALREAGSVGVSIKDLVHKLESKSANVHAWFNMTGKKVPGLKKIGRGHYRLAE